MPCIRKKRKNREWNNVLFHDTRVMRYIIFRYSLSWKEVDLNLSLKRHSSFGPFLLLSLIPHFSPPLLSPTSSLSFTLLPFHQHHHHPLFLYLSYLFIFTLFIQLDSWRETSIQTVGQAEVKLYINLQTTLSLPHLYLERRHPLLKYHHTSSTGPLPLLFQKGHLTTLLRRLIHRKTVNPPDVLVLLTFLTQRHNDQPIHLPQAPIVLLCQDRRTLGTIHQNFPQVQFLEP